jgi:PAS domain S-box-containing protein
MMPENRKAFQKEIEENGFVRNYAVKFRKKKGEEIDCLLTARIRRAQDGSTEGYHGIIRDVTEYNIAEKALQESEARYRAIVEDQTEMICRFIPTKTITFVNEAYCRYVGKKSKDLIGSNLLSFIHKPDQAEVEKKLRNLSLENPVTTYEHRVKAPDNTIRWQQWTSRMLLTEENHMIEFQAVGRDITEKKVIEEELRESSEKIKLFAYSILHDLKSPVIGIYGLAKLLQKNCKDNLDGKARHYTGQILKSAEIIAALVEQINVYIATKETPMNLEPIKIKEILQIIKEEFSTILNIRQIKWSQPKRPPILKADRLSILRVLRNLVDNALKYGGDELKEIKIGYEAVDDEHVLSVYNDGAGIKSEDSQNIFKQFSRQKSSKGVEGAGLGLAIVKEIAERHGGKVWVDSPKNKGATFYLSISKKL